MPEKPIEVLSSVTLPEEVLHQLRAISPRIHVTVHPAVSVDEISDELWNRVEVLFTEVLVPNPARTPNLRWVQYYYAGMDIVYNSALAEKREIRLTSMSGASAIQEGEYILMGLLALGHRLPELMVNRNKREWPVDRWERFAPRELEGATVGMVGYGSIAREAARMLQPFGCKILAAKKDVMHPEDKDYSIKGHGDPEGNYFTRLYPIEALKTMLKECDFVVVTVPLTRETVKLIGEEEFCVMKPGAFLVHISRGGVVDEAALMSALQEKRLGGAVVDVFGQEPLPPDSPLWKLPNLIITPHISGFSPVYKERAGALFAENLQRYVNGEPLFNLFEPDRSY
jgi:phosphoglycerate dehydrogenase-like enzyme